MPWIGLFVSGLSSWKVRVRSRVSPKFCGRQSGTVAGPPPSRVLRLSSVSMIALMLHIYLHLNADFLRTNRKSFKPSNSVSENRVQSEFSSIKIATGA